MAPKKVDPPGTGSLHWVEPAASRLNAFRTAYDAAVVEAAAAKSSGPRAGQRPGHAGSSGSGVGPAEPPAAGPAPAVSAADGPGGPKAGLLAHGQLPTTPLEEQQALRFSRHTPLNFSPTRRAVMIEGRPVVVPGF